MKYVVALLFLVAGCFAQDVNKLDGNGKKHGLWKGVHEESQRPRYEGTFEHGKETGVFKFFDDTKAGTVIATREFNPKDNSCYTIFYNQKGSKVSEGKLVNKKFEGEWKYYHEDSPQMMTLENYVNGKLEGVRKVYYKGGKLAEETTYKNGVKHGAYKKYAENDVVLEESVYKNGQYEGLAIFRNALNQIASQGNFKEGKKVGKWKVLQNDTLVEVNMNKQGKKFQKRAAPIENE